MAVCCFKQAAIVAPCKIYCSYSEGTYRLLGCAEPKQLLQKAHLEIRSGALYLGLLFHPVHLSNLSTFVHQHPMHSYPVLSFKQDFLKHLKAELILISHLKSLGLRNHFLRKHLRSHLCVQTRYLLLLYEAQQKAIQQNASKSTTKRNEWHNVEATFLWFIGLN